jgi:hypothetical protein
LKTASNYPIHQSRPPIQNGAQKPNATVDVKDKLRELAMTAQTAKEKNKELVTSFMSLP